MVIPGRLCVWRTQCVQIPCGNEMWIVSLQPFANGSFSNITTADQFKITVLQLCDECLFVKLKLYPCWTGNLLINILLVILLCATEPEQNVQHHCMFWSVNVAITGYIPQTCMRRSLLQKSSIHLWHSSTHWKIYQTQTMQRTCCTYSWKQQTYLFIPPHF